MHKSIINLLLVLFSLQGYTQNRSLDSLIHEFKTETVDTNKYNLCVKIAKAYSDSAYDKSLTYLNTALEIAQRSSDRNKLAQAYHQIGILYHKKGEFPTALKNYNDALIVHEYLKNKRGIGQMLNDIGLIYKTWGKYEKALEYYINALKLFDEIGDQESVSIASNNIGQIFYYRNDYEKAIEYFTKYLDFNKKNDYPRAVAGAANNIASAYMELNKLDLALNYYLLSLKIYDSLKIKLGVGVTNDNIGSLYLRQQKYIEALSYHNSALKIFEGSGSQSRTCVTLQNIGVANIKLRDYDKAIGYLERSLDLAKKLNLKETQKDVYANLSEVFQYNKQFEKAFACQTLYQQIKDSLINAETIGKIETIQAEYESQKKENELAEINKKLDYQKKLFLFFVVLFLVFLFLIVLAIRENIQKKKIINISKEQNSIVNRALNKLSGDYISLSNQIIDIKSLFSDTEIINSRVSVIDSPSYVSIQTDQIRCFAFATITNRSINYNVVLQSIIEFLKTGINEKIANSLFDRYISFIKNHSSWSIIIEDVDSVEIDFWIFDLTARKHIYIGSNKAYCLRNGVTVKLESNCEWSDARKDDVFYFISGELCDLSEQFDKNSIVKSVEKTLFGSTAKSFEDQKDILVISLDFIQSRLLDNNHISISAFKL